MSTPCRITFLQTHPVQYMAPLFRYITHERRDIELTVLYASTPTPPQQGVGFDQAFAWDVTLTEGYSHRILSAPQEGREFDAGSFGGADVGPIFDAIAASKPDVTVIPGWHSMFYMRGIAACRRLKVPILYRGDSSLLSGPHGPKRIAWSLRTRAALRMFDGYLSVGSHIRSYLRHFGAPEPLIFDSPHAIDNDYFAIEADRVRLRGERDAARREMGAAADDFLVLFAGKFIERKRPGDVIAAASRLGGNVVVAMAGSGPLLAETRAAAEKSGVRVSWCGFLNQSAMPRALVAADCVAVPSRWESWGLIVNEALAAGTPCVVSTGAACVPDLVRDGSSGAVHAPGDTESLVAALSQVRDGIAEGVLTPDTCRAVVSGHSFERAAAGLAAGAKRLTVRRRVPVTRKQGHPRILGAFGNMVLVSGVERMSFEVLRTLRERDAAVHCVVNSWESSKVVDRAEAIGASWSFGYYYYELRRRARPRERVRALWDVARTSLDLLRDARRFGATHVFAPEFHAVLRSAPALCVLRALGVRVILRLGNAPEPGRFYGFLWRSLVDRCVDHYAPNSKFIQRELLAHGIDPAKTRVIYNTVPHRDIEWRPRDPVPGRIIYVGQIIPPKGVDVLLDAVGLIVQQGFDVTLDVVGVIDGWESPSYEGYREGIRRRACAADLVDRVRFLGQREDVPALMAQAAVHCVPSRPEQKEGFTVVTLEAKRAALPSVVTQSGALPEMVRHTLDGWICSDVTPAAIAEGLLYFLCNPERARRCGDAALASERMYNRERFSAAWAEVFSAEQDVRTSPLRAQPF
jgi:glycosyltransferase involved in cell wall biosynthesis